jgi:hypothetical protein
MTLEETYDPGQWKPPLTVCPAVARQPLPWFLLHWAALGYYTTHDMLDALHRGG